MSIAHVRKRGQIALTSDPTLQVLVNMAVRVFTKIPLILSFTHTGELYLFIIGNSQGLSPMPELLSISSRANLSEWDSLPRDLLLYNGAWDFNMHGMVGALINDEIQICGGGKFYLSNSFTDPVDEFVATTRCQRFDFESYTWSTLGVSLLQQRTFAQSVVLENGTWLILGGQDSQGRTHDTTEFLDVNATEFVFGVEMAKRLAKHCVTMVNRSLLFAAGGKDNNNGVTSRGTKASQFLFKL